MRIRKKIFVGNWKMNPGSLEEAKALFSKIKRAAVKSKKVHVVICPSFIHLSSLARLAKGSGVFIGAQDLFWEESGAFTGQVSASMIADTGARYAIIGHSERRAQGDTNTAVAKKLSAAIKRGLTGILCIGESERDKEGNFYAFIKQQLLESLSNITRQTLMSSVIIAYEPVWAIGKEDMKAMSPSDVHEMNIYIRKIITDVFGPDAANALSILYGGSVSSENAASLVFEGEVDGLLVGRQSLEPQSFSTIVKDLHAGK